MYEQEKIKPYKDEGHKREQVERMFDRIAHSYDRLNHFLSWGIDKSWRRTAVDSLSPFHPCRILDVATGTGDFAILSARRLSPQSITGVDISEGMMQIGRQKVKALHLDGIIRFQHEDCEALSFADDTFDAVTVAYGVRNFEHLDQGLREMCRVLKPGGHLLIIELSSPHRFPMKQLFSVYAKIVMPLIGRLVSLTYRPRWPLSRRERSCRAYSGKPVSATCVSNVLLSASARCILPPNKHSHHG